MTDRIEIKAHLSVDEAGTITGTAWPFGTPDRVGDVIERGAFAKAMPPIPMLAFHDQKDTVGVWTELAETAEGLTVKGRLLVGEVKRADEIRALIHAGALTGLSIGFVTKKAAPRKGGGRTITDLDLIETSIVAVPAHPGARITSAKGNDMTETTETTEMPDISAIEAKMTEIEKKADPAPLLARLDKIEAKLNRGGEGKTEGAEAIEAKALASFVRTGSDHEIKQATSASDPEGGYFILPTVDLSIRNLLADVSPMRSLAEVIGISGNTYERFYSTGARGAQWVGETDTRPQDTARPNLIKHSYGVAELYAAPAGTRHLFEDASIDIASWFTTWAVNDFAVTEGEAFLTGDGAGGRPRGLMTYPVVAAGDATRAWGEMQYVPAGHASAPTDENWSKALIKIVLTLHPKYRTGAAWLMNNATLIRIREIMDSNKRFMFADHGNLSDSPESGTLLGYPVHIDNNMPDIGADALPIAFGNFKQGYVVVDRHGIRIVRDEVSQKGTILLDTYKRVGGGLGDSNAIKFLKIAAS